VVSCVDPNFFLLSKASSNLFDELQYADVIALLDIALQVIGKRLTAKNTDPLYIWAICKVQKVLLDLRCPKLSAVEIPCRLIEATLTMDWTALDEELDTDPFPVGDVHLSDCCVSHLNIRFMVIKMDKTIHNLKGSTSRPEVASNISASSASHIHL